MFEDGLYVGEEEDEIELDFGWLEMNRDFN